MSTSAEGLDRRASVNGLPPPTGPYSWTTSSTGLVFVSGLRGIDEASGQPVPGDRERVQLIFERLQRVLDAHHCHRGDVLSTTVYVTDMARIRPLVNDAYQDFFGAELPTRTIVEVQGLNQNDSVEIDVVFARR